MNKEFFLFDINKDKLKKVFSTLSRNEKRLPLLEFQKFCLNIQLIPVFNI